MRVLAQPIDYGGRRVGTLRVANPLTPVQQAQASLRRTFLVVGLVALALAVAAGIGLATLIAAPLRRMARVAAAVDAGDLSMRAGSGRTRAERSACSPTRSTTCSTGSSGRSNASATSSRTPRTSCAPRSQCCAPRSSCSTARPTSAAATKAPRRCCAASTSSTGSSATCSRSPAPKPASSSSHARSTSSDFFEDLRRDLPLFGERDFQLQAVDGTLQADPDRLTQVLRNLVRNAVAHTNPGDRVTVAARARDGRLEISVSDSGPGIPPDQLEQIFERFHRLDRSRSRDRGGSGLGLAIARAITEAHGGSIHAESGPGQGATFRIELPGYRAYRRRRTAQPSGPSPRGCSRSSASSFRARPEACVAGRGRQAPIADSHESVRGIVRLPS